MSIINDALNKAGRRPQLQNSGNQSGNKKGGSRWTTLALILVLVAISGPIVVPMALRGLNGADAGSADRRAQFGAEELPLFPAAKPMLLSNPGFRVSGIVFSPAESYSLINDKVVKVGDQVNGSTVVEISENSVLVEGKDGKRTALPVGA